MQADGVPQAVANAIDLAVVEILDFHAEYRTFPWPESGVGPSPSRVARHVRDRVPEISPRDLEAAALLHLYGLMALAGYTADQAWQSMTDVDDIPF